MLKRLIFYANNTNNVEVLAIVKHTLLRQRLLL